MYFNIYKNYIGYFSWNNQTLFSFPLPSFLSGLLSIFCVCSIHLQHHLSALHPNPVAVLCCQHLCVGTVCVAHRWVIILYLQLPHSFITSLFTTLPYLQFPDLNRYLTAFRNKPSLLLPHLMQVFFRVKNVVLFFSFALWVHLQ